MKVKVSTQQYQNELIFYPYNYYGSFGQVGYPVIGFQAVSQTMIHKKVPKLLKYCEELFDKDVLEIKQLVKDIGDLKTLIYREQKKFVLYDDSNIISDTFSTELKKNPILWHNLIALRLS